MARNDLDALIAQISGRLPGPGAVVESLRQHPVLYEVVGRWPPSTPLRATPADVDLAIHAVRKTRDALARALPGDPATHTLKIILQRLNESVEQGLLTGNAGDNGDDSEEIVGPWPPK